MTLRPDRPARPDRRNLEVIPMRPGLFLKMAIALAFCAASLVARADVVKIVVDDTIQPVAAEYIDSAIQEAHRTHADSLLIEMNTPGGLMVWMREIIEHVRGAPVPVII